MSLTQAKCAALAVLFSATAVQEEPPANLCPKTCIPSTTTSSTSGSGWSVTVSDILVQGKGRNECQPCSPCRVSVSWSFVPTDPLDLTYRYVTDATSASGVGGTSGLTRGQSNCDEVDVSIFQGFDGAGSGGTPGVLVQLYCLCPS